MDLIDIRIELGSVSILAAGQTLTGNATASVAVDRAGLLALLQATPATVVPVPVIPVAIDNIHVDEIVGPTTFAEQMPTSVEPASSLPETTPKGELAIVTKPAVKKTRKRRSPLAPLPDQELRDAIVDGIKAGAVKLGVRYNALLNELKRRGFDTARRPTKKAPQPSKVAAAPKLPKSPAEPKPSTRKMAVYTDEQLLEACAVSIWKGAQQFGVNYQMLYDEMKRRGLGTKRKPQSNSSYLVGGIWNNYGVTYMRAQLTALSVADAAKLFNCTENQVEDQKRQLSIGVPRAPAKKKVVIADRPSLTDVSDNELRKRLTGSWEALADEYGVDVATIAKEGRRLNIARPIAEVARTFTAGTFRR